MAQDEWLRETELTAEELAEYRRQMDAINDELGRAPEKYTCDKCGLAGKCKFVFDGWNTDGDCLLDK